MKNTCKLVLFLILIASFLSACTSTWIPDEGHWFCEELQMHFDFDNEDFYFVKDGKKIECTFTNEYSSKWIGLTQNHPGRGYEAGDEVLEAEYVFLSDREYVVKEYYTGVEYTFVRQDIPE